MTVRRNDAKNVAGRLHDGPIGTVCITGATSGIGRVYALEFARRGYRLIVTGRREEHLRRVLEEARRRRDTEGARSGAGQREARPPREDEMIVGDLRDAAVRHAVENAIDATEDLSVLVHNAGYGHRTSFLETPTEDLIAMGTVHMQSAVAFVHRALTRIDAARSDAQPAIVLVSSLAAFIPAPGPAIYTSTKAFLVSLGRALHPAAAQRGIAFQVLCPGFTHTEFHDRLEWSLERRRDRGFVRWMSPESVVTASLRDLSRRHRRGMWRDPVFVPGWTNRVARFLLTVVPRRLYVRRLGGYADGRGGEADESAMR